ncbi:purine-nucleoside phosphorylase [Marinactinospora thermotolerans DSM 45154]|uniref:Purine nucleoside phosphorylase n=1 Tax=Marinactinospora thermotolerans DSM 45154 TaxID=1122192 RepID=A0A1T4QQM4_9ACTN|nr:purine-nucleoside phosphorylase [Marinactinospora thermotolerans]SKA06079.1 purine-nucleoside phosphorylase [Marinactinospora thermotolerans DSM 45154]
MSEPTQDLTVTGTAGAKEGAAVAASELLTRTGADGYDAVVVLGSGWAGAADALGVADIEIDVGDLPGFVAPSAAGHASLLRTVWVGAKRVAVFMGRVHLYEGYGPLQVTHAVRTGVATGARTVVLTGSAGSMRVDFSPGQPVVVRDHINLTGESPLVGPDFVDLTTAYSPRLRAVAHEADPSLAEGVYAAVRGPAFATPAELGLLRLSGADLVGTSMALETIAAVEMGAEVLGLSVVSNDAVGPVHGMLSADRLLGMAREHAPELGALLNRILLRL